MFVQSLGFGSTWCGEHGLQVMAYSPLEQGHLRATEALLKVARDHGVTPYQVALAWVMRHEHIVCLVKSSSVARVRENAAAAALELTSADLAVLDDDYPPPTRGVPLATL